jgi:hypothetical protein
MVLMGLHGDMQVATQFAKTFEKQDQSHKTDSMTS